jgi:hypothetical protein
MRENHYTQTSGNPWKHFWLGVNATAAAGWSALSAAFVVLSVRGDVKGGATVATVSLLLGFGWLVGAIRSLRASGQPIVGGLFWYAASTTLATAMALVSALFLDLTQKSEAIDPATRTALGSAIGCGLIWFAISIWGAANALVRAKRERY